MALWEYEGDGVVVSFSPLESRRFGLRVWRLAVGLEAADAEAERAIDQLVADADVDLLIARWNGFRPALPTRMIQHGSTVLPTPDLMYWERPLATQTWPQTTARLVDQRHQDATLRALAEIFGEYANHYSANPRLSAHSVAAGYLEWARSTFSTTQGTGVVVGPVGKPRAVATLQVSPDGASAEVMLAGVIPEARGSGTYDDLLAGCCTEAARLGADRIIISTQSTNLAAQRAWARMEWRPQASITTVHAWSRTYEPEAPHAHDSTRIS